MMKWMNGVEIETEDINSRPFDVGEFICSEDMRNYYKSNREFSLKEKAYIISKSQKNIFEKRKAFQELVETAESAEDYDIVKGFEEYYNASEKLFINEERKYIFLCMSRVVDENGRFISIWSNCYYSLSDMYKGMKDDAHSDMMSYCSYDVSRRHYMIRVLDLHPDTEFTEIPDVATFIAYMINGNPQIIHSCAIDSLYLKKEGVASGWIFDGKDHIGNWVDEIMDLGDFITYPFKTGDLVRFSDPVLDKDIIGVFYSEDIYANEFHPEIFSFVGYERGGEFRQINVSYGNLSKYDLPGYEHPINCITAILEEDMRPEVLGYGEDYTLLLNISRYLKMAIEKNPSNSDEWFLFFGRKDDENEYCYIENPKFKPEDLYLSKEGDSFIDRVEKLYAARSELE